jgi:hypothetical protein
VALPLMPGISLGQIVTKFGSTYERDQGNGRRRPRVPEHQLTHLLSSMFEACCFTSDSAPSTIVEG